MKTIRNLDLSGKTVLMRVDFNVPLDSHGVITDNFRIESVIPTINYLIRKNAKVILCSHLGRPKGKPNREFSLQPIADELSRLMKMPILFSDDDEVVGEKTRQAVQEFKNSDKQVMLLQNLRYRKEETENDPEFSKQLADLADLYIMEAFGAAHRAHASTVGVTEYLPAYGGFLIEKEVQYLMDVLEDPERPFTVILGGKKVSDKIGVIEHILPKADNIIIGGAMAFTFLKSEGYSVGTSFVEEDKLDLAKDILGKAEANNVKILLPIDVSGSAEFSNETPKSEYSIGNIPDEFMGLDIGSKTEEQFRTVIMKSKTVVMNGPMGVFEMSNYENGTKAVIEALADFGGMSIIGGGDSTAAVSKFHMEDKMTHISTGGGASLEMLEGRVLPGLAKII